MFTGGTTCVLARLVKLANLPGDAMLASQVLGLQLIAILACLLMVSGDQNSVCHMCTSIHPLRHLPRYINILLCFSYNCLWIYNQLKEGGVGGGILKYRQREWKWNGKAVDLESISVHCNLCLGPSCFFLEWAIVFDRELLKFQSWIYKSSFQTDIVTHPFRTANLQHRLLGIPVPYHPGIWPNRPSIPLTNSRDYWYLHLWYR